MDQINAEVKLLEARIRRLRKAYKGQQAINRAYRTAHLYASPKPPPQWAFDAIDKLKPGDLEDEATQ